jgi:hypothetical protein
MLRGGIELRRRGFDAPRDNCSGYEGKAEKLSLSDRAVHLHIRRQVMKIFATASNMM